MQRVWGFLGAWLVLATLVLPVAAAGSQETRRLYEQGNKALQSGDYEKVLANWQDALVLVRKSGDRGAEGFLLNEIGLIYYRLGQYDRALERLQAALVISREVKDRANEGANLNSIGLVYEALGQYERALEYFQAALAISKEVKERGGEGATLNNIGRVYEVLGQYDRSLKHYQAALAIRREVKDRAGEGNTLNNIGLVYGALGQYDRTLEHYLSALAINREVKDSPGEGTTLANIGLVYKELGRYDRSLKHLQAALAIKREVKDRSGESITLNSIGVVYQALGMYDRALKQSQMALVISREVKDRANEGATLNNIGLVYESLGQYDRALEHYQAALSIKREIKDRPGEGATRHNIGLAYSHLGQYDRALEHLQAALALAQKLGRAESTWKALAGMGWSYANKGQFPEAVRHLEKALDTIEALRGGLQEKEARLFFMKGKLIVYDKLIFLFQEQHQKNPTKGYDKKALEIFERKQGRSFLEEMGKSGARHFAGLPEEVRAKENGLEAQLESCQSLLGKARSQSDPDRQRLQELERRLRQIKTALLSFNAKIAKEFPAYHALKHPMPTSLEELQTKVLNPGEVMLVYGVMENKTCLWVIGKEVFQLHTLPVGEKDLGQQIGAFRQRLQRIVMAGGEQPPQPGQAAAAGDKLSQVLYGLLIPPEARPGLPCGSRLYIIPTGPLYALPFEALETQALGQPSRYLVEDYAIAYLSSASLLKTLREAQARKQAQPAYPFLAFANPRYGKGSSGQGEDRSVRGLQTRAYQEIMGGRFVELPETEDEAREIRNLLQAPEQSHPLQVKEAASRSKVLSLNQTAKLSAYRYLVFACHAILPGEVDRVVQPALVLSYPEKEGYLTMADVFSLKLNADLVTLSACNTGRGFDLKGEGVMGLTRAFMYAGTPAVSVTLWPVETQSAKLLDVGMHRYLHQGQGRAEALREIKLDLLRGKIGEQYRNPFFWAPFIIFGDGQ